MSSCRYLVGKRVLPSLTEAEAISWSEAILPDGSRFADGITLTGLGINPEAIADGTPAVGFELFGGLVSDKAEGGDGAVFRGVEHR